jgi:DNA-binding winged helix-turn-helix (wHTH) protein
MGQAIRTELAPPLRDFRNEDPREEKTWIADPRSGELERGGKRIRLEPKLMEVLVLLHGHRGEVVSKQQLLETVWEDCFVTDDVIWRSISVLRRVLGDDPRRPRIIETLPRRGYRYLAGITLESSALPSSGPRWWQSWLTLFL